MLNQNDDDKLTGIKMNHIQILADAVAILRDRNEQYGEAGDVFGRACNIYELITGEKMNRWQASMFLHSLKLARMRKSPLKMDNYKDGINYVAFAAEFTHDLEVQDIIDDGIREMAEKLSPQYTE
jgi:hypothetical protein